MADVVTTYRPPPTVARFMRSDAPVRLIMGPVGCTDADTEFLTPCGWKRIADYTPGDQVLQWEEGGHASFVVPLDHIQAPNHNGFWHFHSEHTLDMMLTPNHRVPLYQFDGKFVVKDAQRVAEHPSRHVIPTTFSVGSGLALTDVEIRLRVMIAADGHYPKSGHQCVVTVRRERKKDRIRWLLEQAGIPFTQAASATRPTETRFVFARPDFPKPLHESAPWFRASSAQLAVLLEEATHWDGLHDHAELRFSTAKREEADVVQFAAHACGRRASIRTTTYEAGSKWLPTYTVQWTHADSSKSRVGLRGDTTTIEWVPANGAMQYCFTVPSTFWVARRNGCVFVTGNSGKSTGNIMEIAHRAAMQAPDRRGLRRTRWAIVRSTYQQLKDTTLKSWFEWFPDGVAGRWREYDKTFFLEFGDVRAEVMFRALDDPEDVRRLLSLELTGAFVNEGRETPLEIITALRSRVGRYPSAKEGGPTWYGLIMDTNPPSTDHWIYQKFEEEKPTGWEIFKQPGGLDPDAENLENLPATYYQDMMDGADKDWINVHVHAKYGRSKLGRPVYEDTFVPEFHCADGLQPMHGTPLIIGQDFGRTPAAALFQRDARGRVLLLDELVSENMGLESFIDRKLKPLLNDRYPGFRVAIGGDPAGWAKGQINEQSCADVIKAAGFVAVRPPTNLIAPRLRAVEHLLKQQVDGKAMFLIDKKRCPTIVAGFEHGYRFKKKRDGTFEDSPEKNSFSHPHDAVQYGALVIDAASDVANLVPRARKVKAVSLAGWT